MRFGGSSRSIGTGQLCVCLILEIRTERNASHQRKRGIRGERHKFQITSNRDWRLENSENLFCFEICLGDDSYRWWARKRIVLHRIGGKVLNNGAEFALLQSKEYCNL